MMAQHLCMLVNVPNKKSSTPIKIQSTRIPLDGLTFIIYFLYRQLHVDFAKHMALIIIKQVQKVLIIV